MLPSDPVRHHRIKKIIIGLIIVPIIIFVMLIMVGFVSNVFERSKRISQGDYSLNGQEKTTSVSPAITYDTARQRLVEGFGTQSFGSASPKLTIVEFADFACPYCKQSFTSLREFALRHADTVKIIFRDWPGHTNSVQLALAAYCAGEQGKFWEMHDKLYQNQATTFGADKNDLANLALQLNIYNEQFQNCFDTQKYLALIDKNLSDSKTLGVRGTPTWFIDGEKVEGTLSLAELEQIFKVYVTK
jgi:protein-disulfide isomerase